MQKSPWQLALPLKFDSAATFANYWPGKNPQIAVHLQQLSVDSTSASAWIYIAGAPGNGVSHLLQATINQASEHGLAAIYLSLREMIELASARPELAAADLMESLEHYDIICVDDVDALAGQALWQEALFYLLIKLQAKTQSRVVFGATVAANNLDIALADLRSRLAGAATFSLRAYTDDDKANIMQCYAEHRAFAMSEEIARFIVQRYSRELPSLLAAVDKLDQCAISESRKLTIPFAKKILRI